jgi:prevent-host-death family protein
MRFSARDCQRKWGTVQDAAIVQPVTISNNGRDRLVMMSVEEYRRLKRRDRHVMTLADFTDADVAAIEAARAPEEAAAFDDEVNG